jgi:hypothetical protein
MAELRVSGDIDAMSMSPLSGGTGFEVLCKPENSAEAS